MHCTFSIKFAPCECHLSGEFDTFLAFFTPLTSGSHLLNGISVMNLFTFHTFNIEFASSKWHFCGKSGSLPAFFTPLLSNSHIANGKSDNFLALFTPLELTKNGRTFVFGVHQNAICTVRTRCPRCEKCQKGGEFTT